MTDDRYFQTATLLGNGTVLVAGGNKRGFSLGSAEIYNPATGTFSLTESLAYDRYSHTATLLADGTVPVTGGRFIDVNRQEYLASAEVYDPRPAPGDNSAVSLALKLR